MASTPWMWRLETLLAVLCEDESAEYFQVASQMCADLDLLGAASEVQPPPSVQAALSQRDWHYACYAAGGFTAIALGSNQARRLRAGRLGLALTAIVARGQQAERPEIQRLLDMCESAPQLSAGALPRSAAIRRALGGAAASSVGAVLPTVAWSQAPSNRRAPLDIVPMAQARLDGLWAELPDWTRMVPVPDLPLTWDVVEQTRLAGKALSRKIAHKVLKAVRDERPGQGQMIQVPLTRSGRPWAELLAAAADSIRSDLVGGGVVEVLIEIRPDVLCPYESARRKRPQPQPNYVVVQVDGRRVVHHPHKDKDEPLRFQDEHGYSMALTSVPDQRQVTRAFRVATKWRCAKRWEANGFNVFQERIQSFKQAHRPEDWELSDFRRGEEVQSWLLSPALRKLWLAWLAADDTAWRQGHPQAEDGLGLKATKLEANNEDVEIGAAIADHTDPVVSDRVGLDKVWDNMRRSLVGQGLGGGPARAETGEEMVVESSRLRYTQKSISEVFGDGRPLEGTIDEIVSGALKVEEHPNFVLQVIRRNGQLWSNDNRRLFCINEASKVLSRDIFVRAKVFTWDPAFDVFLKRPEARGTDFTGQDIHVRRNRTRRG